VPLPAKTGKGKDPFSNLYWGQAPEWRIVIIVKVEILS
jgi:hypothetical protein